MIEQYYFGQGKIFSRRKGVSGAKWRWWGDVSELNANATPGDKISHKESYSGLKSKVRSIVLGNEMTLSGTLHQLNADTLADLLGGVVTTVAGGAVTGEDLGTVVAGDIIKLDYPGVSSLVVTDSLGTPATIAATHYDSSELAFGSFEFLSLPSSPAPTMPLKAAYSYAGHKQVAFLASALPELEFRYEGVNLAENSAPVVAEFYKLAPEPLQQLALITNGNTLGGAQFTLEALADLTKPVSGSLGRFGRILEVTPS